MAKSGDPKAKARLEHVRLERGARGRRHDIQPPHDFLERAHQPQILSTYSSCSIAPLK